MVKPEIILNVERWRKGWRRKRWLRKKLVTLAMGFDQDSRFGLVSGVCGRYRIADTGYYISNIM